VRRGSILVVDDDEGVRAVLADTLECDGHHVATAADAFGALDEASARQFDIAFIDVRMPGHDGPQTLRMLRGLIPHAHCIMISGIHDAAAEAGCVRDGAEACLHKPLSLQAISALVAELLERESEDPLR